MRLNLSNKGDTIVEVLIALAILSLAFVFSYSIANRALLVGQNSQEHSLALEYATQQIETLRYESTQGGAANIVPTAEYNSATATPFCLLPQSSTNTTITFYNSTPPPPANATSYTRPTNDQCFAGPESVPYYLAIVPMGNDTFNADVWWISSLGIQREEVSYRVYDN